MPTPRRAKAEVKPVKFDALYDKNGPRGCWLWRGTITHRGTPRARGQFYENGRMRFAHRVVWSRLHGPIPFGLMVCHSCDNPLCVNPAHLWLGTGSDNIQDCVRKGRQAKIRQTHCRLGHALVGSNVYATDGYRRCRQCRNQQQRDGYRRRSANGTYTVTRTRKGKK